MGGLYTAAWTNVPILTPILVLATVSHPHQALDKWYARFNHAGIPFLKHME